MSEAAKAAYAPWWARTAAMAADSVIFILCLWVLQEVAAGAQLQNIIYQSACAAYFILLEGSGRQASLGKSLLKIHVAMDDGGRASFLRIVIRYFIWTFFGLPFIGLSISPGYAHFVEILVHLQAAGGNAAASYIQTGGGHAMFVKLSICFFIYAVPGIILYWLPMIFTREKIGLHDFLTRTRVYKRPG
jgi:uncharacterized RDD family membrane protein YckC